MDNSIQNTQNISHYEKNFEMEGKEKKLLSTMALTSATGLSQ
jgi:hypothetical protein